MTSVDQALSYDKNAIGIGRKGTIDHPYKLEAPFWTVDTLFYALPCHNTDLDFALCLFLNVDWKSKDESTGLPSLSKQAINESAVFSCEAGEQQAIGQFFSRLDSLITLHQRKRFGLAYTSVDNARITISTSLFSSSRITCRYVSCVVFMLACPNRLDTLAIETPANSSSEAWVCLRP